MAELAAKLAKPGSEECPICMVEVPSVKILPCSHALCETCLSKLAEKQRDFSCPVCRTTHMGKDSNITKYFGELRCSNCLKMKEVDEFFWCCDCEKLICCRCIGKEHGFEHQLLEWNRKEAFLACFQGLGTSQQLSKDKMERNLQFILKPLITDARILLEEKLALQSDITASLAKSYGLDFETIRLGKTMKNFDNAPKLLRTLGSLAGFDIPTDFSMIGAPSGIRDKKRVLDVLMEELEFSQDVENPTRDKYSQTDKNKESATEISNAAIENPKSTTNPFISKSHKANSFVNATEESLKFGPFDLKDDDKFLIGPTDSFAVLMKERAVIFQRKGAGQPSHEFSTRSVETSDLKFIDAALDGKGTLHLVAMKAKYILYYNNSADKVPYSLEITPDLTSKKTVVNACITCTITGVPFLFAVIEGSNTFKTSLYKFGAREGVRDFEQYGLARQVCVQPHAYIKSACAVKLISQDVCILGADFDGIHVFLKCDVAFEHLRYIPMKFALFCGIGSLKQCVTTRQAFPDPCELKQRLSDPTLKTRVRFYTVKSGVSLVIGLIPQDKDIELESNTRFAGVQKESLVQFCVENSCGSGMLIKKL